eukprot:5011709-Amphidinium_carterae.1
MVESISSLSHCCQQGGLVFGTCHLKPTRALLLAAPQQQQGGCNGGLEDPELQVTWRNYRKLPFLQ